MRWANENLAFSQFHLCEAFFVYEQFIGTPVAVANTQLCAIFYVVDNVRCSSSAIHF